MFDYLIVGAGLAGSVLAERLASRSDKKILLVDKRNHIGGNAYDYYNKDGILVHKYGSHIFHTNNREVFSYLGNFTQWRPYEHRVLASVDGMLVPVPINLNTINQLYGLHLTGSEINSFLQSKIKHSESIRTSEDVIVNKIGKELYEKFFKGYIKKQFNVDPSQLDTCIASDIIFRNNLDDRYYADTYQAVPLYGYTRMFDNMLNHPNIKVLLNTDYKEIVNSIPFNQMIYTGPIDYYFDYFYGRLPYRSLEFKFKTIEEEFFQKTATVNYPNEHPYTRVTEFKHITGQKHPKTSISYEYPIDEGDPYYPVSCGENSELYSKYELLASAEKNVHFAGRLANYKYYNMDEVVEQSLGMYKKIESNKGYEYHLNGNKLAIMRV